MDAALEKYKVKRVYKVPPGLDDLMTDISREVLREQPINIYAFIAKYLEALLDARNCCRAARKAVESTITYGEILANVAKKYKIDVESAHKACKKIQSVYRGYRTRQYLLRKGRLPGRRQKETICYIL